MTRRHSRILFAVLLIAVIGVLCAILVVRKGCNRDRQISGAVASKPFFLEFADANQLSNGKAYRAQVIVGMRDGKGDVIVPVIQTEQPRKGFMDSIYYEKVRQPLLMGMRQGTEPELRVRLTDIELPVAPVDSTVMLLIKLVDEPDGWRLMEVPVTTLSQASSNILRVPELNSLPLRDDSPTGKMLWAKYVEADKHRN